MDFFFLVDMQMQRSITNELYSEIMRSSGVELDRESTAVQANDNLQGKSFVLFICFCLCSCVLFHGCTLVSCDVDCEFMILLKLCWVNV